MELFLRERHFYERWFYKVASKGLYPTIFSAIGFAYIAIPPDLQAIIRHWIPLELRLKMLELCTSDEWLIALLVISVVCVIWGGVGSSTTVSLVKKMYKCAIDENELLKQDRDSKSINCYKLFSNYLYTYYSRFDLSANERISLYKLDMGMFSCIGRYSDNEIYREKPNRLYPQDQGCISVAWSVGKVEESGAPNAEDSLEEWIKYNKDNFNFSEDSLMKIKMKSSSFYGFRLRNDQHETVAVILFESINADGLKFGKLNRFFNEYEKSSIAQLVTSLENHIPSLDMAKREGF